jgi:hypothetical protein
MTQFPREQERAAERYFRDPAAEVLAPGMKGAACQNVRHALSIIAPKHAPVGFSDEYDADLGEALRRFQISVRHERPDGKCGPATRTLLARALLRKAKAPVLERMADPENRTKDRHIFISYAREDARRTRRYIALLEAWGFTVWSDVKILGGDDWAKTLNDKIAGSFVVVLFLSKKSVQSQWVNLEIKAAHNAGARVVPIMLDVLGDNGQALIGPSQLLRPRPVNIERDEVYRGQLYDAIRGAQLGIC